LEIYTSGTKCVQNVWTEIVYSTGEISANTDTLQTEMLQHV